MKIEFRYDFGSPNKPEYQRIETERFCRAHDIRPQVPNPHFPVNTLKIMRVPTSKGDRT